MRRSVSVVVGVGGDDLGKVLASCLRSSAVACSCLLLVAAWVPAIWSGQERSSDHPRLLGRHLHSVLSIWIASMPYSKKMSWFIHHRQ